MDAITLYVDAFRLIHAATLLPKSLIVAQLQRSFERVRELGDLSFDQGTAQLSPLLGASIAGTDVAAASRIPDWSADGLAPGLPLVSNWVGTTEEPSGSQPLTAWSLAVQKAGAPSQISVHNALNTRRHSGAILSRLAKAFDLAEVTLCAVSPPDSDPQTSALVRLGWLVDAEALLAAESGVLSRGSPSRALAGVSLSIAEVGANLRGTF